MGGGPQGMKMFVEPLNDRNPQPTRLDVMVPMRAKVWVKTATAEIEVTGVTGELDLYVVGGKIRVTGSPSELNAEAIDGDIEVNGKPGWLRAKSASGTVTFNGSSDDASISTVSGGITVNSVPAEGGGKFERAKLETVTGPIRFNADIQRGAAIDFSTHSGTLDIAIPRRTGADFEGYVDRRVDHERSQLCPAGERTLWAGIGARDDELIRWRACNCSFLQGAGHTSNCQIIRVASGVLPFASSHSALNHDEITGIVREQETTSLTGASKCFAHLFASSA
jgi:hypothetical protein